MYTVKPQQLEQASYKFQFVWNEIHSVKEEPGFAITRVDSSPVSGCIALRGKHEEQCGGTPIDVIMHHNMCSGIPSGSESLPITLEYIMLIQSGNSHIQVSKHPSEKYVNIFIYYVEKEKTRR